MEKILKKLNVNTNGNRKLQNTDKIRYMIWNLPAEKTCPFATEHCKKSCYAKKAERIYKGVYESRLKNFWDSENADFVENMIYTIETLLNSKAYAGKKAIFRIHESGDFYNMEYAAKWCTIAKYFKNDKRITFLAYTKSIIYFNNPAYGTEIPKNMIVRSSLWDDTTPEAVECTRKMGLPIYTALSAPDMEKERANGRIFSVCTCENCSTCGKCWNKKYNDIIVKIH